MSPARRAVRLLLLLPLAGLLACQEGPTEESEDLKASHTPIVDPGNPGQGGPPNVVTPDVESVPLGLAPANSNHLVDAVQDNDWPAFWQELRWDLGDDFSGEVAVWGVRVVDGEQQTAFLTDPVDPTGTPGPAAALGGTPPDLIPTPDSWMPGTDWVPGDEFLPTGAANPEPIKLRVATFFRSDAWIPNPDNWIPNPENWVVNGIVDGIWQEAPGAGVNADVGAKLLVIPVATEPPSGVQGKWGTGGILVGFEAGS